MATKRETFLNQRVVKAHRNIPLNDLPESPITVLKGVGDRAAELLYESFYVRTVRDLADLKYILWAQEILALEKVPQSKIDMHGFEDKLIKQYEATPIKSLLDLPISVLQGVSEADEERMRELGVKSVRNFAKMKHARWAQEILREAYGALSTPAAAPAAATPAPEQAPGPAPTTGMAAQSVSSPPANTGEGVGGPRWLRILFAVLFVILMLVMIYFLFRGCGNGDDADRMEDDAQTSESATEPTASDDAPADNEAAADEATASDVVADGTSPGESASDAMPASESSIQPGSSYAVQDGDTLYSLSRRAYGDDRHWRRIYEANRGLVANPNLIIRGQNLSIPARP